MEKKEIFSHFFMRNFLFFHVFVVQQNSLFKNKSKKANSFV